MNSAKASNGACQSVPGATATSAFKFNRMELAGSLGDLGVLLPLGIGMVLINGLDPMAIFLAIGLFYIFSGLYFRVTAPVEPMKVISAYAIATGITAAQIQASSLLLFILLLIIGGTGLITLISRNIPKPVIRGVQLSTGLLLVSQGMRLMMGTSAFQELSRAAEPYLIFQGLGPLPIGLLIGAVLAFLTLLLLDNRRVPAALLVVGAGLLIGLVFGTREGMDQLQLGVHLPALLPYGLPSWSDISFALLVLVLPQIPMTVGNAVIANADLSHQYFPETGQRVNYRSLTVSMALANLMSFLLGGFPMCHGAGGLASRYCFGARTAGSNLIIGSLFVVLALLLGSQALAIIYLMPMSALGVLLVFAGAQLSLTIMDLKTRKEFFVPVLIVSITLASNLAAGFIVGIIVAYVLRSEKLKI
jgi:sulfate permease, SulP family